MSRVRRRLMRSVRRARATARRLILIESRAKKLCPHEDTWTAADAERVTARIFAAFKQRGPGRRPDVLEPALAGFLPTRDRHGDVQKARDSSGRFMSKIQVWRELAELTGVPAPDWLPPRHPRHPRPAGARRRTPRRRRAARRVRSLASPEAPPRPWVKWWKLDHGIVGARLRRCTR